MAGVPARTAILEPTSESGRAVRRMVAELVEEWGLGDLGEDAALCATELVTNAMLHTREDFTVAIRQAGAGLRIDVLDARPDRLPTPVPASGSAVDLTTGGLSGRGLQVVAGLASRWGISTTADTKTVWVELTGQPPAQPTEPVRDLRRERPAGAKAVRLQFEGLPVRTAVASGIQVDDLVRQIQLDGVSLDDEMLGGLFDLLDRSADVRLSGRNAALRAAAQAHRRFDLGFPATADALAATADLAPLLLELGSRHFAESRVTEDVAEFRAWLNQELAAQLAGGGPSVCSLDA
jgi:anti-sigma regulatory factor (Ser/Thr protein kinase)